MRPTSGSTPNTGAAAPNDTVGRDSLEGDRSEPYLLLAMPAAGMLRFALNGAPHVLFPHVAAAGLADRQPAGEIAWIRATLASSSP